MQQHLDTIGYQLYGNDWKKSLAESMRVPESLVHEWSKQNGKKMTFEDFENLRRIVRVAVRKLNDYDEMLTHKIHRDNLSPYADDYDVIRGGPFGYCVVHVDGGRPFDCYHRSADAAWAALENFLKNKSSV